MAVIEAKNIKKSYGKNETKFDALKGCLLYTSDAADE